jgi:peptidoglycan hydrolase-like protein with peptidoglycan-binding domain
MLQTHLPVDTSKKKRRLAFLLGTFLVAAILVAAVLVAALVFSLSTEGQAPTTAGSGKEVHAATSPTGPISATVGSQNIVTAPTPTPTLAPVPTRTPTTCPATIESGSTGSLVISLQSKLNALYAQKAFPDSPYHFTYPLAKDGIFGPQTENAVKDFQTKKGIAVDGIVGPVTWHNLGAC